MREWRIPHNRWEHNIGYDRVVSRIIASRHVAQGAQVDDLESAMAARFRPGGHCAVVSSGSAALYLALTALGVTPVEAGGHPEETEDPVKVSVPSYSCVALLNAVRLAGGRETIVDVDLMSFNAVDRGGARWSIYVDTYGRKAIREPEVEGVYQDIEDFTHAPGAPGCGSRGVASVISFGATKPLGVGAGGAVLGDESLIQEIRSLRDYDRKPPMIGRFNWQLSDIHAAMVLERLRRLDEENEFRRETAVTYNGAGLSRQNPIVENTNYRYVLRFRDTRSMEMARAFMSSRKIETIVPLDATETLHRIASVALDPSEYVNSDVVSSTTLSIPIWPGMSEEEVEDVRNTLEDMEEYL